jgi:hypothetical protein
LSKLSDKADNFNVKGAGAMNVSTLTVVRVVVRALVVLLLKVFGEGLEDWRPGRAWLAGFTGLTGFARLARFARASGGSRRSTGVCFEAKVSGHVTHDLRPFTFCAWAEHPTTKILDDKVLT